jgi:uncharacterized protein
MYAGAQALTATDIADTVSWLLARPNHVNINSIEMMQPAELAALAVICLLAGIAKGLTGFGAALIMAPLFAMLTSSAESAVLIVLLHAVTGLQGARTWWSQVQWPRVIWIAVIALLAHQLMLPALSHLNDVAVRRTIGGIVLLLGLTSLFGLQVHNAGGVLATAIAGAASGVFTALGGLGGPPVAYYFTGQEVQTCMRSNLLAYFMLLFSGAAIGLAAHGNVTTYNLGESILLAPFFVIGMFAGGWLFSRMSPRAYDRVVQLTMTTIGGFALFH